MCLDLFQNNPHWVISVYFYVSLLFSHPAIFKQTISRKLILAQRNPNNCLYIIPITGADMKPISQLPMETQ